MSNKTFTLSDSLYEYLLANSLREPPVMRELREETAKMKQAVMQIAPEQGQLMQILVRMLGARRCVEIGVFTGYSALAVALALPPDGRIVACDVNAEWTAIAQRYWEKAGVAEKIGLRLAPALQTLDELLAQEGAGRFDFAFIDADKGSYLAYYDRCMKLLRPGGLIAVDNTLWSGAVADPKNQESDTRALREFNSALHTDSRVAISLLPVGDGLTLALKL